jgi:hypothetical protein
MSVPTAIFIDTSVLDEQNYNFSSSATSAFLELVKDQELILLLPDPTRREIERHIEDRSQEVIKVLEQAKRKAPFLKKWKAWPVKSGDLSLVYELHKIANDEWNSFLGHFKVENLDYDGVALEEVMNWYDDQRAPFGAGRKRKEFPDAFSLAALLAYVRKNIVSVAVVSKDKGFERACEFYSELLYFPSLPTLTEAMLLEVRRVEKVKEVIENDPSLIVEEIKENFLSLGFYHTEDYEADIDDVEVDDVTISKVTVVHIGGNEVTIAFESKVDYSAYVRMDDHSTASIDSSEDWYMVWEEYRGTVQDQAEISGIAKCSVSSDWKTVKEVVMFEIQEDDITVEAMPEETFPKGED